MPEWKPVLKAQRCCDAGGQSNSKVALLSEEEARLEGGELPGQMRENDEAELGQGADPSGI